MNNGTVIEEEKGTADAHPNGQKTFRRSDYVNKFKTLTDGLISEKEAKRFLQLVQNLKN